MKMKNLVYILLPLFLFSSCDEDFFTTVIQVDAEKHESLVTLNGHFTDLNSTYQVLVSNSLGIIDTANYTFFEDATVGLFEGNNLIADFGFNPESKLYEFQDAASLPLMSGTDYTLKVDVPEYPSVEVTQKMPSEVEISSAEIDLGGGVDQYGEQSDVLTITFEDNGATEDYYELEVEVENSYVDMYVDPDTGEIINDTVVNIFSTYLEPDGLTGERGYRGTVLFNDKVFNGKEFSLRALGYLSYIIDGQEPVKITAKLSSITADRYFYQVSYGKFNEADGNPFAEPVIIHENVTNGHGVFTLGKQSTFEIEL